MTDDRSDANWPRLLIGAALLAVAVLLALWYPWTARQAETGGEQLPPDFWDHPIAHGIELASLEVAGLPFQPKIPDDLGQPLRVLATDHQQAPSALREVAWVFQHADYGRFVILERIVEENGWQAHIRELASVDPGCEIGPAGEEFGPGAWEEVCHFGDRSLIPIRDGIIALLFEGDTTTTLEWTQPLAATDEDAVARHFTGAALLVEVIGPAEHFAGDEAVAITNRL